MYAAALLVEPLIENMFLWSLALQNFRTAFVKCPCMTKNQLKACRKGKGKA